MYLHALDASFPCIFLILVGFTISFKLVPSKYMPALNGVAIKVALPISVVYNLGRQNFELDDISVIVSTILAGVAIIPVLML